MSTGYIPIPTANKNTRAREVPHKRLTGPSQYDCRALHVIFGIMMFAEICRIQTSCSKEQTEVTVRFPWLLLKVFKKFTLFDLLQIKTFVIYE